MDLCPARYLSSGLFLIRNGWNAGQPIGELTYWLADQLTYILTHWPILHWPTNCEVTYWPTERRKYWQIDWLTYWLDHWLTDWPTKNRHTGWPTDVPDTSALTIWRIILGLTYLSEMEESSSNLAAGEIRRHQTSPYWTKSDLDTWYRSLQQVSKYRIYTVVTVTAQGRIHEIQNGWPRHLPAI